MLEVLIISDIKPNDGGHTPFGVDIDPKKDLVHNTNPDGSTIAYFKGSKMKYGDYINELEHRFHTKKQGKDFASRSLGLFGGFGKGKLKKETIKMKAQESS